MPTIRSFCSGISPARASATAVPSTSPWTRTLDPAGGRNGFNKLAGEWYHLLYNNVYGIRALLPRMHRSVVTRRITRGLHRLRIWFGSRRAA